MGRNTLAISITARLHSLLFTAKLIALEKVIHRILSVFVNTLTVDEKPYLLTRDNSTQTIQIQLSQKQKTFSHFSFFFAF